MKRKTLFICLTALLCLLPLSVKASYEKSVTVTPSADATIISEDPANHGTSPSLIVENDEQYSRFLVRFDLGVIPSNASIQKATLTLYQSQASGETVSVSAYKVTSVWSEATVSGTDVPSADLGVVYGSLSVDTSPGSKSFSQNFSELVQSWITTPSNNFGLVIEGPSSTGYLHQFGSRESGNKPTLEVVYSLADEKSPSISSINIVNVDEKSAQISWTTDEASTSFIEYGKDTSYGKLAGSGDLVTAHQVTLKGLESETVYHFVIISKDASDNETRSADQIFTTKKKAPEENDVMEEKDGTISDQIFPPLNLTAVYEDGKVKLSWEKSKTEGVEKFNIYRSSENDTSYELIGTSIQTNFTDDTVEEGNVYFYTVRAVVGDEQSGDSNEEMVSVRAENIIQEVTGGSFWKGFLLLNAVLLPVFGVGYYFYRKRVKIQNKRTKKIR